MSGKIGKVKEMEGKEFLNKDFIRLHTVIHGRVQGVGFRAFTQRVGIQNRLTGWVRNRWNGTVEAVAEGSRENLESYLHALHRGPFSGTTSRIVESWLDAKGDFQSFTIRMTA
jgi:acylphosphatase